MARKRKASGPSQPKSPKELDPKDARINLEDLSESESWQGQDEITFDEAPSKKQRRQQEEEEFFEESEDALDYGEEEDSETDEETAELARLAKRMAKKGKKSKSEEAKEEEDEGMEGWGTSKKNYYGADQIDAETEALEEEAEAKRLQKKKRAKMTESDFIESEWLTAKDDEDQEQKDLDQLRKDAEGQAGRSLPVVKYRVCGSYVATLGMYFALLTSPVRDSDGSSKPLDPAELRDHEVMTFLLETREAWQNVKDLQPSKAASAIASIPSPPEEDAMVVDDAAEVAIKPTKKEKKKSKKAARETKEIEDSLADLDALITTKTKKPKKVKAAEVLANGDDDRSDFGDEEALGEADAQEKVKRKKSLRFYTSQIVQKAQNRADRSRLAGGDDDVPIKERLRDRQARLNAEAIKRGTKISKLGTNLGDGSDDEDKEVADSMRKDEDAEYYDMIAAKGSQNKAEKAARKEALANAGRADQVVEKEEIGEDGRRIITYQIEEERGLDASQEEGRQEPEIRLKYAKAQKKLKSMKATYSGGEGRGGYDFSEHWLTPNLTVGGEATGIKGNLIKSTKL
ncbi:hypothetical protein PG994_009397 [Apiospora phragmitis]|uniref:Sas10 C-terminal domain-containing protein n=1 Tax=Apiospora phragmitis TaxID=2905665 RepID=A0ABR1UJ52_9PEZI